MLTYWLPREGQCPVETTLKAFASNSTKPLFDNMAQVKYLRFPETFIDLKVIKFTSK